MRLNKYINLSHRRHTGRILPHHHTSYPALVMMLLCVGVLMATLGHMAKADNLYGSGSDSLAVHTSVVGPAPVQAASIVEPVSDSHFKTSPQTVRGSCSVNTYVALLRNGFASGTVLCSQNGTFSIETDLFEGLNELQAQVYNTTDVPGPAGQSINIYYEPVRPTPDEKNNNPISQPTTTAETRPYSGAPTNASPSLTADLNEPLLLKAPFSYKGHYAGQPASWQFATEGGREPYAIDITWGDGQHSLLSLAQSGDFSAEHVYEKAGQYHGSYTITVTATDSAGNQSVVQTVAIINDRPVQPVGAGLTKGSPSKTGGSSIIAGIRQIFGVNVRTIQHIAWTGYVIVVLMVLSFWLGERREYDILRPRLHSHRRPHHKA